MRRRGNGEGTIYQRTDGRWQGQAFEMLGHSTTAITADIYSHVTPTMQRGAAAARRYRTGRNG